MNQAIELHDSCIAGVEIRGHSVAVRLAPAYVHRSDGEPGVSAGSGWHQEALLQFHGAALQGKPHAKAYISDGALVVQGRSLGLLPVPFLASDGVTVSFQLTDGSLFRIEAQEIEAAVVGEASYVEAFPGHSS